MHAQFIACASNELPKALRKLQSFLKIPDNKMQNLKESSDSSGLDHLFGLLGGLLVGTSGHRPGVILNLTTEEFENCKEGQDGFAIFVKNHKTCKTFGHAIVPVTKKEYKCMSEFQKLRNKFEGSHSAHFFK